MRTIKDMDIAGKTVLLRADYNVPVRSGEITDDYRIQQSLPTVNYLLGQDCRLVIISHLGRPEGKRDNQYSLEPVEEHLTELIGQEVVLAETIADVDSDSNQVTLLENLRFWPGEEANDEGFAKQLAGLGEVFVQDGFGVVHRAHASTEAVAKLLPSVAGLLLDKEISTITEAMDNPERPSVAVVGGAKVSDKLEVLHSLIPKVDRLIIGGAMANTFLINCPEHDLSTAGKSLYEDDMEADIAEVYAAIAKKFGVKPEKNPDDYDDERVENFIYLPREDVAVAKEIADNAEAKVIPTPGVGEDDIILDYGSESLKGALEIVETAGTVIWNGPLGMTEVPAFAEGSKKLAQAIVDSGAHSIVGGGDTAGFVQQQGMVDDFSWVSTGGGAALDLMAGLELPGVAALDD